jgi:diguanylate cyclase (GGDEF)-like protein/PAS domain S-box-containing protein
MSYSNDPNSIDLSPPASLYWGDRTGGQASSSIFHFQDDAGSIRAHPSHIASHGGWVSFRSLPHNRNAENVPVPGSRIGRELDVLREKIADLKMLEGELTQAQDALTTIAHVGSAPRTATEIRREIESRLGFLPSFFVPALDMPEMLESLWQHARMGDYENPLPGLFKERLFAQLARYSRPAYFMVVRSCMLLKLGTPAGDLYDFLMEAHPAGEQDLAHDLSLITANPSPLAEWPAPGTQLERSLLRCSVFIFLSMGKGEHCRKSLCELLGPGRFGQLLALLSFAHVLRLWLEAFPEISYEDDPVVRDCLFSLLRAEPRLAALFHTYYTQWGQDRQKLEAERALKASEERYRELFENAIDMLFTLGPEGELTSINKAAERITGYSVDEALRMKFTDLVAPDFLPSARDIIRRQIAGDSPATFELDIIAKSGHRVALEISTRPIFRNGLPFAIQGLARDITERKKTEEALHLANQKLEAWVNELEQRTHEMTLLSEMGDMLRACLNTDEAYNVIIRIAQQIFPVQVGALYVITPSRNLVEAAALWGNPSLVERIFSPEECWGLRRGRVHWVEDANTGLLCKHLHQPPPNSYLCVPMMAQSEALGVLHLTQPEGAPITEAKQRLAVTMAEHIAMALSNLKLHETLRSQSIRDPLTGLFNRRFMEESLELELRRAARNQKPLGVIMVDVDRFNQINDGMGRDAGDAVLRDVGGLLQSTIRKEDIACRISGQKFAVILPNGTVDITLQRAENLRQIIRNFEVKHRRQAIGSVTVSAGVAAFPDHGRIGEALLRAADGALSRAMQDGGDRVTVAT